MIHAMGWLIKITLFSILILVLGNWIHWNGRTVSDQVKTQISHAERSGLASSIRRWTNNVAQDVRSEGHEEARKTIRHKSENRPKEMEPAEASDDVKPMEKIPSSERQKLRALIQELNTTTSADRRGSH
jgi:hypothetical protein